MNSTDSNEAPAAVGNVTDTATLHNLIKGEEFRLTSSITDGTDTTFLYTPE